MNTKEITFLTDSEIFGDNQLEIIKRNGTKAAVTDYAILLGGYVSNEYYASGGNNLKERTGYWWSASPTATDYVRVVDKYGSRIWTYYYKRNGAARPASSYTNLDLISPSVVRGKEGIAEVLYGEYPQFVVSERENARLEELYKRNGLKKTGKFYTSDCHKWDDYNSGFTAMRHEELEYNGKKYVRVISKKSIHGNGDKKLSNGVLLRNIDEQPVFVEVEPIPWLVDEKSKTLLSKRCLFSGVKFNSKKYDGNFQKTDIKKFIDTFFVNEMKTEKIFGTATETGEKEQSNKKNPYNFNFGYVSEEDIIGGAVESGVSVFLHGLSGDGKSAE